MPLRVDSVAAVSQSPAEHFSVLFQSSPAAQCLVGPTGRFLAVNPAMSALLGRSAGELLELDVDAVTPIEELDAYRARLASLFVGSQNSIAVDRWFLRADGSRVPAMVTATVLRDGSGAPWCVVASALDRTDEQSMLDAVRASEERFRALVEQGSDLVVVIDRDGAVRYLSPSAERLLGAAEGWQVGREALDVVHPDDVAVVKRAFCGAVRNEHLRPEFEYRVRHPGDGWRVLRARATNMLMRDGIEGVVFNALDVTEHREAELALRHLAVHDPLTGLVNRTGFVEHLRQALDSAVRGADPVTVLVVDLDRFKVVNESYGHPAGDAVLVEAGERIRDRVRDDAVVARTGGDEFLVCCPGLTADAAVAVATRILEAFGAPFDVGGRRVYVSASIGLADTVGAADTPERLLRDVDAAVHRAKVRGPGRLAVFDHELRRQVCERIDVETGLRAALATDQLRVHYQPQVDLEHEAVIGVEALLRWQHPARGWLAPAEFIPIAEETGIIHDLGSWVLHRVCVDLPLLPGQVSVNLSARQLDDERLIPLIEQTLTTTGADPTRIWIEVTESVLMADAARHAELLGCLRQLGLRIAIDDFGTGYSSLAYLKRFPVDVLKIDRSFVDGVGTDPEDTAIAEAIITLAHTLGMEVVAEGVEVSKQRDALRSLGCELGQGFLWSPPLAVGAFRGGALAEGTVLSGA